MQQRIIRFVSLAVFFPLFIGSSAYGQQWRSFTSADGLTGNSVNIMLEDRNGNLWFGTRNGLSQFNGFFITHLIGMTITSLLESKDGAIWAGTSDGLCSYDGMTWKKYENGRYITFLLEARNGIIWVGTPNGVLSYDRTTWKEQQLGGWVQSILEAKDGAIWVGASGLHIYNGITWQEQLSGMSITSLLVSKDGTIWAGTHQNDLNSLYGLNTLYSYDGTPWKKHLSEERVPITSLLEAKDGMIWAGTRFSLFRYTGKTWITQLNGVWITSLFESKDGTVWAGTTTGLYSYNRTSFQEYLSNIEISSLLESKDGKIWVGTKENGLHSYDRATWIKHLSGTQTRSLLESRDGRIWAGAWGGIYSYDGITWQTHLSLTLIDFDLLMEAKDGKIWAGGGQGVSPGLYSYDGTTWKEQLENIGITSLLEVKDGTIWAGGMLPSGLYSLYSYDGTTWKEQLENIYIKSLLEAKDGTVWAGGDGLSSYDGLTWKKHLIGMPITSLLGSKNGRIWAGTTGGLYCYDGMNGMTWQEHLSGINITVLLEGKNGKIWAGTMNGLYCYDGMTWQEHLGRMEIISLLEAQDGKIWGGTALDGLYSYDNIMWQKLTVLVGLPSNYEITMLEDSDGNIWFGTKDGVGMYKPRNNSPVIEIIDPQEKLVQIGTTSIFIEWKSGDIETPTNNLTYQYKINDGSWTLTKFPFITLTKLLDGKTIFYVRAVDSDFNYSKSNMLTIVVDTIQPTVVITAPKTGSTVVGTTEIMGTVLDIDLKEYKIQYGRGDPPKEWSQIGRPGVQSGRDMRIATWNSSDFPLDKYTIRLTAVDIMGHERYDEVVVQVASASEYVIKAQGRYVGELSDRVSLYIPPNALKQDMQTAIILVEDTSVVMCADIGPAETILNKPATLRFHYDDKSIQSMDKSKLSIFYWNGSDWQRVGGTVDAEANRITTVITRFGRYAVKEDLSYGAIGDAVNIAQRTEGECEPGYVAITEATYIEVKEHIVVEPMGMRVLRGKNEPVMLYRVISSKRIDNITPKL